MRRRRTPPKGYVFTDDNYAWYFRRFPHWHINESDYGDPDGRCFTSEHAARKALWRLFQRDYDVEQAAHYTHYVQASTIDIVYPDDHQPSEITLGLLLCAEPDDCYMLQEKAQP